MVQGRQIISYALDLLYGVKQYSCGWLKPAVVQGYFNADKIGRYQKLFFDELLHLGFKRTYWQLVFPNQTAGLVKKIPPTPEGVDEYHIRFYSDGVIDCELEVNRFNGWHWVGPRKCGKDLLEDILDTAINNLSAEDKEQIRRQFGVKLYSNICVRR